MTVVEAPIKFATRACGHRVPKGRSSCPYCAPPRLSVEPLAEAIREYASRHDRGVRGVSFEIATRLGMDFESINRQVRRILAGDMNNVALHTADAYAVAIGQMPAALWGREWDDASPVEPYGDEEW